MKNHFYFPDTISDNAKILYGSAHEFPLWQSAHGPKRRGKSKPAQADGIGLHSLEPTVYKEHFTDEWIAEEFPAKLFTINPESTQPQLFTDTSRAILDVGPDDKKAQDALPAARVALGAPSAVLAEQNSANLPQKNPATQARHHLRCTAIQCHLHDRNALSGPIRLKGI